MTHTDTLSRLTYTAECIEANVRRGTRCALLTKSIPVERRDEFVGMAFGTFAAQALNGTDGEVINVWGRIINRFLNAEPIAGPANFTSTLEVIADAMEEIKWCLYGGTVAADWQQRLINLSALFHYVFAAQNEFNSFRPVSFERNGSKLHATRKCQACWSHRKNRQAHVTAFMDHHDCPFMNHNECGRDYCYGCREHIAMIDPNLIEYFNRLDDPNDSGFMESRDEC